MLNKLIFYLIFIKILKLKAAEKVCDFADCNHEGECFLENNQKICNCFGDRYFKGPQCSEAIDLCEETKPCQNGGKCQAMIGQYICKECAPGFGGLMCDIKVSNLFRNLIIYFNHYGFYAEPHKFLIITETLGNVAFSLEFVSDHYAIDGWETNSLSKEDKTKWIYSNDLEAVIKKYNIRYYNDLPYKQGYYHLASETFWDYGLLKLILRCYDTETGTKLFYQNTFDLLIKKITPQCVPQLKFFHGDNPLEPLMVDIAQFNNFKVKLNRRCFEKSNIVFKWSVHNSIGTTKLYDFGTTKEPLLKVPPYKLWFNYHGEVMSSYQILLRLEESFQRQVAVTQARCFILVLPKPIKAIIKGGSHKIIGIQQHLYMDGTQSRDFALAPNVKQDMIYRWDCVSINDPNNHDCREKLSSAPTFTLNPKVLEINSSYKFTLHINSKVNKLITDQTSQIVQIGEQSQLLIDIQCIRNCIRQHFTAENFIHLRVMPIRGEFSKNVFFNWSLDKELLTQEQRLIYFPKEKDLELKLEVVVKDGDFQGKAIMELRKNLPPKNGACSIEPQKGEAFVTEFHIKCENYQDDDLPINYQYFAGNFPLQRINDAELRSQLPECIKLSVKICDQFKACRDEELKVEVSALKELKDLKSFMGKDEIRLGKLLQEGDVLKAMILMKSLIKYIKTGKDLWLLIKEIEKYDLKTLLDIEQFLEITKEICSNIDELDYKNSYVFMKYIQKLNKGFESVFKDGEIADLTKSSYEKFSNEFMDIMDKFSKSWESIPQLQIIQPQVIKADNPLAENYDDLPDFDELTLKRTLNWLQTTRALHKCFDFMGLAAVELYYPLEKPLLILDQGKLLKIYALEKLEQHKISLKQDSLSITLNEQVIQDLKDQLHSDSVLLQIAALDYNPFWWYPDNEHLNTDVFYITAFSRKSSSSKSQIKLKHPIQFQLKLNNHAKTISSIPVEGVLRNNLHMPLYHMEINANALIIITFIKAEKPLKVFVGFTRNPISFEVKQNGRQVLPHKLYRKYVFINKKEEKAMAHLALLLDGTDTSENISFAFTTEIRECLYWDFDLPDPQWSSKGCLAKVKINKSLLLGLKCECYHLSAFAAKTYSKPMQVVLGNQELLKDLPLNWSMILFYISLLIFLGIILAYNFFCLKNHKEYLISNSETDNNDIEIRIYTGSQWNAGSSANISLQIVSAMDPFTLTIYQNPENPHLTRISLCKLRLSSTQVNMPVKIILTNDQAGRYPSWFCRKIVIENIKSQNQQIFHINKWISQDSLEVMDLKEPLSFKEKFQENLSQLFIEWFQFNALWGCWLYEDLNRLERSCIWISQFMVSLCVVACYYGPTSMETYELERELYYTLNFEQLKLLNLAIICYVLSSLVKLIFIKCLNVNLYNRKKK